MGDQVVDPYVLRAVVGTSRNRLALAIAYQSMSRPDPVRRIVEPRDDADWESFVELRIAPHPGLTQAQSQAIAVDYGIRDGAATVRVRRALLFYALKRLGLDVAADARPASVQHIVLVNRDAVEAALVAAET